MRILSIEDNPGDARLIREMLKEIKMGTVELECEETLASGLERLGKEQFDVLLLDLYFPDSQRLETLQKVRPFEQKLPVVVLTGFEDEETAQKALESGAQDYLVKGKITADSLERAIGYALGRHSAAEALRVSEEHYRLLVGNASEVILTTDLDLIVTYASPSVERQTGFTSEEVTGHDSREFITSESFDVIAGVLADQLAIQGETDVTPPVPVMIEVEQYRKDGSTYPVEISAGFLRDHDGTPHGVIIVSRDITEKREAEEALRAVRERYRIVAENITDMVWLMDMNMKATWISPSVERLRGFTLEELNAMPIKKNFTPESASAALKAIALAPTPENLADKDKELSASMELEFFKKDGSTFWGEVETHVLRDEGGNPYGFLGAGRDITGRKEAEKKVERAQQEAVSVLMSSPDAVLMFDPETGVILDCNRAAELLLERSRDELVGMRQSELYSTEKASRSAEMSREPLRLGRGVEDDARVITSGGELKEVTIYPAVLSVGDRVLSLRVFHDVSERRRSAQGLRVLNEIALRLMCEEPGGLYGDIDMVLEEVAALVGADRCFVHLSSYETGLVEHAHEWCRECLELTAEGLVGMNVSQLRWLVSELESRKMVRFSRLEELPPEAEVEKAAWGDAGIKALLGVPLFSRGILVGFMGLTSELVERSWRDADAMFLQQASNLISLAIERTRAEEALLESRAALEHNAQELRDILTIASHELRHPATILKGYSHILLKNAEDLDSEVARDALRSIDRASDRLARTVTQLVDASRIESGEMSLRFEELEPRTMLDGGFQGMGGNVVINDKTSAGAVFKADREKLRCALGNLVENAVKFSPEGSPVDVCIETVSGGLLFTVCDGGPGVSEEHAEMVFERFYQVEDVEHHSTPGIGLGLYIAKAIVDEHGGWIRHRPDERGGSVFEFFIPEHPGVEVYPELEHERARAELSPSREMHPPDETLSYAGLNDNDTRRVLRVAVVDDDPDIVKVNMIILESRGYEAIAAYGGEEGLEMVNREMPDVVLLDIMMPGLDGLETCRRLKSNERTRDIPVIFITAKTSEECSEEVLAAGGSGFLSKPFRPDELFESIEEVCDGVRTGVLSAERAER